MRFLTLALLMTSVSGCAAWLNERALCDGTKELRRNHAGGLLIDGGPVSIATGELTLTALKEGCAE